MCSARDYALSCSWLDILMILLGGTRKSESVQVNIVLTVIPVTVLRTVKGETVTLTQCNNAINEINSI